MTDLKGLITDSKDYAKPSHGYSQESIEIVRNALAIEQIKNMIKGGSGDDASLVGRFLDSPKRKAIAAESLKGRFPDDLIKMVSGDK